MPKLDEAREGYYDGGDTGLSGDALILGFDGAKASTVVVYKNGQAEIHHDVPYRAEGGGVTIRNRK